MFKFATQISLPNQCSNAIHVLNIYLTVFKFIPQSSIVFPPKSVQELNEVFNIKISIFFLRLFHCILQISLSNQHINAIDV